MTVSNDTAIAVLRIELEDIEPLIWRCGRLGRLFDGDPTRSQP